MSKRKSNKQFELIYKQILSHLFCDITRCEIYCRNHREREVQYIECDSHNQLLPMFIDLLDSIHCYFCHSVDIGYRIIHKLPPMDAHTAHGAYDSEMAQLRDYLSLNEEILQQLHTKKHWRNNRFMTKLKQADAVARAKTDIRMEGYLRKESLYLKQLRQRYIVLRDDCLYSYKTHNKADLTECIALTEFNHVQICHDGPVGQFELIHDGSKKKRVFVASCMQELDDWLHEFKQIIATYHTNHSDKGRSRAASQLHFGERYDYWSSDRIFPKYATIKEELTSNKIYSIHMDAFNAAFTKSKFLLKNSHKLRNMMTCAEVAAKYNLRWDAVLRIDHVIAVVLWTDYRSLAAQLKSTFTKISKKIYDEFWIWSRFLIEAVNGFGTRLKKSRVKTCYHSVSFMHYTEYETTFNVPTSTTTKLQIIILNTPSNGMILELGHNSDRYTQKQRYFNCSFVSCFGMEDERLFIQPHDEKYYFHVLSIRNLRTNEKYHAPLTCTHRVASASLSYSDMTLPSRMEGVLVRRGNVSRSCTPAPSQCVQQTLSITDNAIRKPFESPPVTVAIERIQTALQYYENMEEKQTDDGQLVYLCNTIYKSLLEDWIHVLAEHPKHPIEPHYTCDILYCPIANRHYFNKMVHDINVETEAVFYRELLDSIHCYVYHLEDVGLRVLTKCRLEQSDDITDLQLAHIRTTQKSKAKILHENGLEMSINIDKTNKYDLIPTMQSTANYQGTLMDMLCRLMDRLYATNNGRFARETQHCFAVLLEEDYDSESVEYDLEDVSQSNFALHSIACYNAIERYLHLTKLYRYTFSIGYRFYYHHWSKFKSALNMTHTPMNDDPNDLQSHSIKAKYKSLQDEILNNTISHLPKIEFNVSLVKANKYLETRKAKQMVCILDEFGYGFKKGDTIRRSHLLSIILYCQYTKLQRELTTTFRKNEEYECIESVIQRHREFAI
eukprot:294073_1